MFGSMIARVGYGDIVAGRAQGSRLRQRYRRELRDNRKGRDYGNDIAGNWVAIARRANRNGIAGLG